MNIIKKIRRRVMLTCEDVNEFLAAYVDDDIPDELRTRDEDHLARCESCKVYLSQYRTTMEVVRNAESDETNPPDELVDMTLDFLDRQTGWSH